MGMYKDMSNGLKKNFKPMTSLSEGFDFSQDGGEDYGEEELTASVMDNAIMDELHEKVGDILATHRAEDGGIDQKGLQQIIQLADQYGKKIPAEWLSDDGTWESAKNTIKSIAKSNPSIDLNWIDVSNVTDMGHMFHNCYKFNGDLSGWDVSGVTNMSWMFFMCTEFNGDLSGWDVSNVTDMTSMFDECDNMSEEFKPKKSLTEGFDFSQGDEDDEQCGLAQQTVAAAATQMARDAIRSGVARLVPTMTGAAYVYELTPDAIKAISDAADMCRATGAKVDVTAIPMGIPMEGNPRPWYAAKYDKFHTPQAILARTLARLDPKADLNWLDTSNVTDMSGMLLGCTEFDGDISQWDTSNVESFEETLGRCDAFNGDISKWDVAAAENMEYMLGGCKAFDGDLSGWDTSNVTNMCGTFSGCAKLNCDLSGWDVSNVTDMRYMFSGCRDFNGDISGWDTSSVTNMFGTFQGCAALDQDLSGWDVSNVKAFGDTFRGCRPMTRWLHAWADANPLAYNDPSISALIGKPGNSGNSGKGDPSGVSECINQAITESLGGR